MELDLKLNKSRKPGKLKPEISVSASYIWTTKQVFSVGSSQAADNTSEDLGGDQNKAGLLPIRAISKQLMGSLADNPHDPGLNTAMEQDQLVVMRLLSVVP